jgi:hypothetical protein
MAEIRTFSVYGRPLLYLKIFIFRNLICSLHKALSFDGFHGPEQHGNHFSRSGVMVNEKKAVVMVS